MKPRNVNASLERMRATIASFSAAFSVAGSNSVFTPISYQPRAGYPTGRTVGRRETIDAVEIVVYDASVMTVDRESLREQAFHLFGQAITRSDPGHLEAWVELGLTLTQLRVLFLLRAEDGASAGGLAERLKGTPSTLTRIVARLGRRG